MTIKTVRQFSRCGPCITLGTLTKETARFYAFEERFATSPAKVGKVMKKTEFKYSPNHVEPCPSCADHPKTQFPNGYMD